MLFSRAFTRLCLGAAVALLAGLPVARAGGEGLPVLPPAAPIAHVVGAVHPDQPDRYPCGLCGMSFYHPRSLERHTRLHTDERPYVCDQCGRAFAHKGNLVRHKRTHAAPAAPDFLLPAVDPLGPLPGGIAGDPAGGCDSPQ